MIGLAQTEPIFLELSAKKKRAMDNVALDGLALARMLLAGISALNKRLVGLLSKWGKS